MAEAEQAKVDAAEGKPGEGKPGEGKPGEGKPGEEKPTATAEATVQGTHDLSGTITHAGAVSFKADEALTDAVRVIVHGMVNQSALTAGNKPKPLTDGGNPKTAGAPGIEGGQMGSGTSS
jgi:hypothetical protein